MEVMQYMKNNIHDYRKKKKMTQEDLAKIVGVTRQTIISIEQGKYVASLSLALKLAKIFEVKVADLFEVEEGD